MRKMSLVKFKEYVHLWFGATPKYRALLAYTMLRSKKSSLAEILAYSGMKHDDFAKRFSTFYNMHPEGSIMYYTKTNRTLEAYEPLYQKGLLEYEEILKSGLRRANLAVGCNLIDGRVVVREFKNATRAESTKWIVQCGCGRKASVSTSMMLAKSFKGCPCKWINEIIDSKLTNLDIINTKVGNEWHCEVSFTLNRKRGIMKYIGDTKHKAYIYAMADVGPRILMNKSAYGYAVDVLERYMVDTTPKK